MHKVIMVQGTMSNVGKSLITAGLCRIFREDGYSPAPFKSQNMALNSYISSEGLEMGRAQVMQAEAAGIEPSVLMNPILLKPTSDTGSQVIVNGKVRGNMNARDYFAYKKSLIGDVMSAYDTLSRDHDIIVVEGAGSPAEINLKSDDIVNMGLARMLGAPVLLVGDIDRGGVFAQLAGTMLLLEDWEKLMVKGLVINKFRGDASLLDPGIEMLKKYTSVPVIGTVPYMNVDIDDEDSLSQRLVTDRQAYDAGGTGLLISVVRLPHLSNFTDLNALSRIEGVNVSYDDSDLLHRGRLPDMLVIPGTKNTIGDLRWMRERGLEAQIKELARMKVPVLGICGGFQMLGESISDPVNAETGGEEKGLGLLPVRTVFSGRKTRTQVRGRICQLNADWKELSGAVFEGYEIHMGESRCNDESGKIPNVCQQGNVCGTYIHGIFDTAQVQSALVRMLEKNGRGSLGGREFTDSREYKEKQYDALAAILRERLDMASVYRILEEGIR